MNPYSKAESRYKDLKSRSFNQIMYILHVHILKKDIDINTLSTDLFKQFLENDFVNYGKDYQEINRKLWKYSSPKDKIIEFDKEYTIEDITNQYKEWEKKNIPLLREFEKIYETTFSKNLSIDEFKNIYGLDGNKERKCDYCDLSEKDILQLINSDKILTKRLYQRGRSIEVDRKNSNKEYTKDNIVLCCYWCNNAKTDEFTYDEFKFIGTAFKQIWRTRLEKIDGNYNEKQRSSNII